MAFTEDEIVNVAIAADRMARHISQRFVLDEKKLEWAGFNQAQIDRIFARVDKRSI